MPFWSKLAALGFGLLSTLSNPQAPTVPNSSEARWPLTRAEATNYSETSHYADVVTFLHGLQACGAPVSIQQIGTSAQGRPIPLAIASFPPITSPSEARRSGRPIIYIQANIHAGEVEGKEAALIVLRRLCQAGKGGLLGKVVLLVAPIYNIDGNEAFAPVAMNRPEQDGPLMVGERANGQGLDLNRDAIKAESPEMRAALRTIYNTWDPDVMMDLHTTDGTRHGYELTYSPPLNPNTFPSVMKIARDELLPAVRKRMEAEFHLPLFDYGNVEGKGSSPAWKTYGEEGRYCTNYVGLRNRVAILSEATTFIPFRARVSVTDKFVSCILDYVVAHSRQIVDATRNADATVVGWGERPSIAPQLGVTFDLADRGTEAVRLEDLLPGAPKPPSTSRPAHVKTVRMPVFDRFKDTSRASFPAGYLIRAGLVPVIDLLRLHGIEVQKLTSPCQLETDVFEVGQVSVAARPFQGHRLTSLSGKFSRVKASAKAGDYIVRTAQPLGILIFHLLEPEGRDGVVTWGVLPTPSIGDAYPIQKLVNPPIAETVSIP